MKYTSGPWKFKYHMNIDGVGIMEAEWDITVDDLHIIGAAKEMYECLKDFIHAVDTTRDFSRLLDAYVKAGALLRRIEGDDSE